MKINIELKLGNALVQLSPEQKAQILNYTESLLDGSSAVKKERKRSHWSYKPWTKEHDDILLGSLKDVPNGRGHKGKIYRRLAGELGHSFLGIQNRVWVLKHANDRMSKEMREEFTTEKIA